MAPARTGRSAERVFIAVELPEQVRDELAAWVRGAAIGPGTRPVPSENMHLTLCFLGNREPQEVSAAGEAVEESARPVGGTGTGAPVWLPRRRPRALGVEVHDEVEELAGLQGDLARALNTAIGWKDERRRFRPHITVARFGRAARPRTDSLPPTPALAFRPEALTLFRSRLDSDGAVYEAITRHQLPPEFPSSGPASSGP